MLSYEIVGPCNLDGTGFMVRILKDGQPFGYINPEDQIEPCDNTSGLGTLVLDQREWAEELGKEAVSHKL